MCLTVGMTPQIEVHSIFFSKVCFRNFEQNLHLLYCFYSSFCPSQLRALMLNAKVKWKQKHFGKASKFSNTYLVYVIVPRQILTSLYQDHLWFPTDGINHNICHKVDDRLYITYYPGQETLERRLNPALYVLQTYFRISL